jgi:hypothetical protein
MINKTLELFRRAQSLGIKAKILKPSNKKYGSRNAPQKLISLNGVRQSLGTAERFIMSREF